MNPLFLDLVLVFIGFALGFFFAATLARWRAEEIEMLHEEQLKEASDKAFTAGQQSQERSTAPFSVELHQFHQ